MMETKKFVVSRKWRNPEIMVRVTDEEIGVEIDLLTLVQCLTEQLNAPLMILTKKQLEMKLSKAFLEITAEMKRATDKV